MLEFYSFYQNNGLNILCNNLCHCYCQLFSPLAWGR